MRRRLTALFAAAILLGSCGSPAPSPTPPPPTGAPSAVPAPTASSAIAPSASPSPGPSIPAAAGNWVRLDDMSLARWSFTAVPLLDDRVLVVNDDGCGGLSELHGPPDGPGPADLLDLATGIWTPADALNAFRSGFVAVRLLDGRVLVTGGVNGWWASYSSTKLFDPATGHWSSTGLLNTARANPVGALLPDGRVLVAGGTYSKGWEGEEHFVKGAPWPGRRELTSAEIYDPETGRWTVTGSLNDAGSAGSAYSVGSANVLPDGRVLVVGGAGAAEGTSPAELYDPGAGLWTFAGRVPTPTDSASAMLADGTLLVVGGTIHDEAGFVSGWNPTAWRFDPLTGLSAPVAPMPTGRIGAIAIRMADGRVLIAGGIDQERTGDVPAPATAPATNSTLIYDPSRDAWSQAPSMPFAVEPGQGVLLSDGSVLLAGGTVPYEQSVTDACPSGAPIAWTARFVPAAAP
jgi:N-acetylneuraminic acid mutarotase